MNSGARFTLPARLALKGHNGRYLTVVSNRGQNCLQFSSPDHNDEQLVFLAQEETGYNYGIKSESLGMFLMRRDDNWIVANTPDFTGTDNNTLFWAVTVDGNRITLHNRGNEGTCGMRTADGSDAWLSASGHTPIFEVIDLAAN